MIVYLLEEILQKVILRHIYTKFIGVFIKPFDIIRCLRCLLSFECVYLPKNNIFPSSVDIVFYSVTIE